MATIRRHPKSGRWQVRYRDPSGRQRARNFERKVDATKFMATVTADVYRGEYVDPHAGRTPLKHYAVTWQEERSGLSRSTRDADASMLRSLILPTFGHRPVSAIKQSDVRRWLASIDGARSYKLRALWMLRVILDGAVGDRALAGNPAHGVTLPKPTADDVREGRALDDSELTALIHAAEEVNPNLAPMVWLMARGGLRVGESLALKRSDIDLGRLTLTVFASMSRTEGRKNPKTKTSVRTIPIPRDLAERLGEHMSLTVPHISGLVFTGPSGGIIRYTNWRSRIWTRIVDQAGIGPVVPHDLRRTCATRLFIEDRWTVPEVQRFLGHKNPAVTLEIYTKINPETLPTPSSISV